MPTEQNSINSSPARCPMQRRAACKKAVQRDVEPRASDEFLSNQEVGWLQGIYNACKERFFKADPGEKQKLLEAYNEAKKSGVIDESGEICPVVPRSVYLQAVFNIFSPLASFVNSIVSHSYQSNDVVKQFRDLLIGVQGQIENEATVRCRFSSEAKKSISDITELLSEGNENRLGDEELRLIIKAWKNTQQSQHLLAMSRRMSDEKCLSVDPKARQHFVESLQKLYELLKEAESLPPGSERDEYLRRLRDMADNRVDVVKHFNEHGGQEGVDPEYVEEKLKEEREIAEGMASDPTLQNVISPEFREYLELIIEGYSLISDLFEELDKKYEEKREEEKQCARRDEQIKQIKKICRNYHIEKARVAKFYELKEYAKRKLRLCQEIIASEKRKLQANSLQSAFANREKEKYEVLYSFAHSIERLYSTNGTYYKQMEDHAKAFLLPSYVCDVSPYNLELDLLC